MTWAYFPTFIIYISRHHVSAKPPENVIVPLPHLSHHNYLGAQIICGFKSLLSIVIKHVSEIEITVLKTTYWEMCQVFFSSMLLPMHGGMLYPQSDFIVDMQVCPQNLSQLQCQKSDSKTAGML